MEPHKFLIGILMFGAFIGGGIYVMFGSVDDGLFSEDYYDVDMDNSSFEEIQNLTEEVQSDVQSGELSDVGTAELDTDSQADISFFGSLQAVARLPTYATYTGQISNVVAKELGIPPIIVNFITAFIAIIIIFMMIYLFLRFQPRT